MDDVEFRRYGEHVRRETRNPQMVAFIDHALALSRAGKAEVVTKVERVVASSCPQCEARRKATRERVKRWRRLKISKKNHGF